MSRLRKRCSSDPGSVASDEHPTQLNPQHKMTHCQYCCIRHPPPQHSPQTHQLDPIPKNTHPVNKPSPPLARSIPSSVPIRVPPWLPKFQSLKSDLLNRFSPIFLPKIFLPPLRSTVIRSNPTRHGNNPRYMYSEISYLKSSLLTRRCQSGDSPFL